jgi:hypothetical protein
MNKWPTLNKTVVNIWIPHKGKNVCTGSSLPASEKLFSPFSCFSRNGEEDLCTVSRNFFREMSVAKKYQRT